MRIIIRIILILIILILKENMEHHGAFILYPSLCLRDTHPIPHFFFLRCH